MTTDKHAGCCCPAAQGLLDTEGCRASAVLTAAGMSPAAAEAAFVDKQMVPTHSTMAGGDVHWAPDARKALQIAAELCTYTGGGCPHTYGRMTGKKVLSASVVESSKASSIAACLLSGVVAAA